MAEWPSKDSRMIVIGRLVFSALSAFSAISVNRTASLRCLSFPYLPQNTGRFGSLGLNVTPLPTWVHRLFPLGFHLGPALATFNAKSNIIGCILAQIGPRPEKTVPFHRLPFGGRDFGEIQALLRNRMEAEQGM